MTQPTDESSGGNLRARMSSLGLETQLEEGDFLAIHASPQDFVLEQLVQGYNARQITEKMVLAGVDGVEAARLMQEIDAEYDSAVRVGRRHAGRRKLMVGVGFLAIGIGAATGMAYFSGGGGYYVFPTGLVLAGIYYTVKGAVEAFGG